MHLPIALKINLLLYLYYQEFIDPEKVEWAHLDIASLVFEEATGANGYGAALLAKYLL